MIPELEWDDSYQPDRGKVLSSDEVEKLEKFYRYLDTDGDGIADRTLPGENAKGAYFVRGSGHNKLGFYTESSDEYKELVDRLLIKWKTAKTLVPKPVVRQAQKPTNVGIIAYGSSDGAVLEALDQLEARDIHADYMRVRAFPFNGDVTEFVEKHETVFVVEQNRDAQLRTLLILETNTDARKLVPVLHYNGMPIPSQCVVEELCRHLCVEEVA
jgi:2-oxoglutarate ferredoxin oxidoreductase subunit alpha